MTGSLQVEETSAYCSVHHRASASNYQLSNMKRPAQDPVASEVGGENSNRYTTEPPILHRKSHMEMQILDLKQCEEVNSNFFKFCKCLPPTKVDMLLLGFIRLFAGLLEIKTKSYGRILQWHKEQTI